MLERVWMSWTSLVKESGMLQYSMCQVIIVRECKDECKVWNRRPEGY